MYKDMGLEVTATFQKGARAHAGASIHVIKMQAELSRDADPALLASAEQLKPFLTQQVEISVAANRGLGSSSPAELDRLAHLVVDVAAEADG